MAEMKHRCERGQNLQMAISARELAETLGFSLRQVWRLSSTGKLPKPLKIGGSARWNRQEIVEWFEAGCPDRRTWQARKEVRHGG